jgi:hypothetical protein
MSRTSSPFFFGYFGDCSSWIICLGCPQSSILLISVSQVARITGVSHWCLASFCLVMYSRHLEHRGKMRKCYGKLSPDKYLGSCIEQGKNSGEKWKCSKSNSKVY